MAVDLFRVTGVRELIAELNALDSRFRGRIGKSVLRKAAKPVIEGARSRVRRDTGLLKKSIGQRPVSYKRNTVHLTVIGPRRETIGTDDRGRVRWPVKYAHLIERGTRPHLISSRYRLGIQRHPGTIAYPFLGPAFFAAESAVRSIVAFELRSLLLSHRRVNAA